MRKKRKIQDEWRNEEFVSMEGEGWKQYNEYIKSSDMLEALRVLLNATREEEEIECSFSNEYIGYGKSS